MPARPAAKPAVGADRQARRGVTETLEVIPRRWKVVQTVREKFTCRDCASDISSRRRRSIRTPRGWAGPSLLATIVAVANTSHKEREICRIGSPREGLWRLRLNTDWSGYSEDRGELDNNEVATDARDSDGLPWSGEVAVGPWRSDRSHTTAAASRPPAGDTAPPRFWLRSRLLRRFADIAASARRGSQAPSVSPLAREAVVRIDAVFDTERAIKGLNGVWNLGGTARTSRESPSVSLRIRSASAS